MKLNQIIIMTAAVIIGYAPLVRVQDNGIPIDVQLPLLSRVIGFDSTLHEKVGADTLKIGILYQSDFTEPLLAYSELSGVLLGIENFVSYNFR